MALSIEVMKEILNLDILPDLVIMLRNKLEIYVWLICDDKENYQDELEAYFVVLCFLLMQENARYTKITSKLWRCA